MRKPQQKATKPHQKNKNTKRGQQQIELKRGQQQSNNNISPFTVYPWPTSWPTHDQQSIIKPKISAEREEQLKKLRAVPVDIQKGIYPFKGIKLDRVDIEWLIVTNDAQYATLDWMGQKRHELL